MDIPYCHICQIAHDPIVEFKRLTALTEGDMIHMMCGSPHRRVLSNQLDNSGCARIEWTDGVVWASDIPSPNSQQSFTEIIKKCRYNS